MWTLFFKTLYDRRWFILGWSLGIAAMACFTVAFFKTLNASDLVKIFSSLPESLRPMVGDIAEYGRLEGYIASGVFNLRIPMLTAPMAIILAAGLTVNEEISGKLYQLLAQPVTRSRIVLEKYFAGLTIIGIIHAVLAASVIATIILSGLDVPYKPLAVCVALSLMLTVTIFSIAFGLGIWSGKRGFAVFISVIIVFGSYLVTSFAGQINWLEMPNYLSLFKYHNPSEAIDRGIDVWSYVVYCLLSFVALGVGMLRFTRRDIKQED